MSVYDLTPTELYYTYAEGTDPQDIMDEGRTELATRLRMEHGLSEKDAFYAADEIRTHAQNLLRQRRQEEELP